MELAKELNLPVENLLTPDFVRRLLWQPPDVADESSVARVLGGFGARPWQIGLTSAILVTAIADHPSTNPA